MADNEKLLSFRVFEGLSEEELNAVLALGQEHIVRDGEKLIEADSPTMDASFFVILEGLVKIGVEASPGQQDKKNHKRLAVLKGGDIFGEMGLLGANRRSAQVEVYSETATVLMVDRNNLFELFEQTPRIGFIIMRNLAKILSDRLVELNFMWRDDIK